jgi:plasmid stability protein
VATIQIRDIPDDVHEELQRQARAAGQSLQAFMRQWLVEGARRRALRAAVLGELEEIMLKDGGTGVTTQQILDDLDADRRR